MMYIFPRQFGLHNVFTSQVDTLHTAQKFQDYTLREEEIASAFQHTSKAQIGSRIPQLPKRLRGDAKRLVEGLQIRHGRCSYWELLRHYCPTALEKPHRFSKTRATGDHTSTGKPAKDDLQSRFPRKHARKPPSSTQLLPMSTTQTLVDLACSPSNVSAFCQAVLSKIIPEEFWGDGDTRSHNKAVCLRKVDHFIKLRRFETMSLHEIAQDFKVGTPPKYILLVA